MADASLLKLTLTFTFSVVALLTLDTVNCQLTINVNGFQQVISHLENVSDSSDRMSSILPKLGNLLKNQNDLQILNNILLENSTAVADEVAVMLPRIQEFMQLALEKMEWQHTDNENLLQNQLEKQDRIMNLQCGNHNETQILLGQMAATQVEVSSALTEMKETQHEMAVFQLQMTLTQSQTLSTLNQMALTQNHMQSTQTQILNTLNHISQTQTEIAHIFSKVASLLTTQSQPLSQTAVDTMNTVLQNKGSSPNLASDQQPTQIETPKGSATANMTTEEATPSLPIQDCFDLVPGGDVPSDVYKITLSDGVSVDVYCDMDIDGGGWTVFQKRFNGSVDFYRGWDDYVDGFGSLDGEFWLGLEIIHQLTGSGSWELQVHLEDFNGDTAYANYQSFSIGDEASNYTLTYDSYSGTTGDADSLSHNKNYPFSTKDRDNDGGSSHHCAQYRHGAWWHYWCTNSNLNGRYFSETDDDDSHTGMFWYSWKNSYKSLKASLMMIRPTGR